MRELRLDLDGEPLAGPISEGERLGPCRLEPTGRDTSNANPTIRLSPDERATLDALGYVE